jgi:ribosomal protein S18 acetylase RimI-like enzyme
MIRPTAPADTPALLEITRGTGLFSASDIEILREVLDAYHAVNHEEGHQAFTDEREGEAVGYVYFAETAMTDRTWHLWWIAVKKQSQARGIGGELLRYVEDRVRERRGRLLLIETSSLPSYELTRRFYRKNGYEDYAVLRNYYADGHHMVVFAKSFAA